MLSFLLISLLGVSAEAQVFQKTTLNYWPVSLGDSHAARRCDEGQQARAILHAQEAALADCRMQFSNCAILGNQVTFNGQLSREMLAKYGIEDSSYFVYYGCEAKSALKGL